MKQIQFPRGFMRGCLIVFVILLVSAIGLTMGILGPQELPSIQMDKLQLDRSQFPEQISFTEDGRRNTEEIHFQEPEIGLTVWDSEYQYLQKTTAGPLPLNDGWQARVEAETGRVNILVIRYPSPLVAFVEFYAKDPRIWYWKLLGNSYYWNIQYDKEHLKPAVWQRNERPNQEAVICANGDGETGWTWLYHARYGQYLVLWKTRG